MGITGYPVVDIVLKYTCTAIAKMMDIALQLLEALRDGEFNPDGLGTIQSVLDAANDGIITEGEYMDACGVVMSLFSD